MSNSSDDYCCEYKHIKLPNDMIDGIACKKCNSYNYCLCKCSNYMKERKMICEYINKFNNISELLEKINNSFKNINNIRDVKDEYDKLLKLEKNIKDIIDILEIDKSNTII